VKVAVSMLSQVVVILDCHVYIYYPRYLNLAP
jgi:hypothetical protein